MHVASLILAAVLSAAVPAVVKYDFSGTGWELLRKPPIKTKNGPNAVTFTIHARTEHAPGYGSSVKVWITPGMEEKAAVMKSCDDTLPAECFGETPDPVSIQQLFNRALNDALVVNKQEFGHYQVTQCDEPPVTRDYGWLDLVTKVLIDVDARYNYSIVSLENGTAATRTQYMLVVREGDAARAQFGPPPGHANTEGLQHVWDLCGDKQQLELMRFVTQMRVLRDEKDAKNATKM